MSDEYAIFGTLPKPEEDQIEKLIDIQYRKIASKRFGDLGRQLKQWSEFERKEVKSTVSDDDIIRSVAINDYVMDFVSLHIKKIAEGTVEAPALADIAESLREQFTFRVLMLAAVRAFIDIYSKTPGDDDPSERAKGVMFVLAECRDALNERFGVAISDQFMFQIACHFYTIKP